METNITCPVSVDRVNETAVRTVAIFAIVITAIALFFHSYILAFLLAVDFSLRALTDGKFSPLKQLAIATVKALNLKPRPIDAAPKKFAAGMGIAFSAFIAIAFFAGWNIVAFATGGILLFCAFLEGVFGICLGCMVYSFMVLPFLKKGVE